MMSLQSPVLMPECTAYYIQYELYFHLNGPKKMKDKERISFYPTSAGLVISAIPRI